MNEIFTFMAGVTIGGLLSWFIAHRYYLKAGADQRADLARLTEALKPRNTLDNFERMLKASNWTKMSIGHTEVWMADADNTYQIECGEITREFAEAWTTVYPDRNSSARPVYLKLNSNTIKELTFVAMDGGRIFVPMAGIRQTGNNKSEHFWNLSSLEVMVCRIIGTYYRYETLEGVAKQSGVTIVACEASPDACSER
jgi:hypothetical protein